MASIHDPEKTAARPRSHGSVAGAPAPEPQGRHPFAAEFEALAPDQQAELVAIARAASDRDSALDPVIAVLVDGPAAQRSAIANAFRSNPALRLQWNGMYGFLRSRG